MPYYSPNNSQLEPYGFYNPSMAGPDWAKGVGFYLSQFAERKQQRDADAQEQERYAQEQAGEQRKMGIEQQRADAYQQSVRSQAASMNRPPGASSKAELDHRYEQLRKVLGDKRAAGIVYGNVDTAAQQQGPTAAEEKEQRTRIGKYIDSVVARYDKELARLRAVKEKMAKGDLPGGDEALERLDGAIKNLGIAAGHVNGIASRYAQSGQMSGEELNMLRDYAMGIERTKENPFITSGRDMPDSETVQSAEQGMAPQGGEMDLSQLPEPIRRVMEELNLSPQEAAMYWQIFSQGFGGEKK